VKLLATKTRKILNDEAAQEQTCITTAKPLSWTHNWAPCALHGDCNEGLRLWERCLRLAVSVSLEEAGIKTFWYDPVVRGISTKGTGTLFPILSQLPITSPLKKMFLLAQKLQMASVISSMRVKYNPLNEISINEQDAEETNEAQCLKVAEHSTHSDYKQLERCRLIGADWQKLCLHTPALLDALLPSSGTFSTKSHFTEYIVLAGYAHNLRCLSLLLNKWIMTINQDEFAARFIGELQLKLIHSFNLHQSVNTFKICRSSARAMDVNSRAYRISTTQSLNIGLYAKGEGPEGKHKDLKSQAYTHSHRRGGYLGDLLSTTFMVVICGTSLFDQFVPEPKKWNNINNTMKQKMFGTREQAEQCQVCGKLNVQDLALLSAHLTDIKDKRYSLKNIEKILEKHIRFRSVHGDEASFSLAMLFSDYLFFSLDLLCCRRCALVCQLDLAIEMGQQEELHFVVRKQEKSTARENSNTKVVPVDKYQI
jgi:hypothetical protein